MAFTLNQLAKIVRKVYTPPIPGNPGYPGQPAIRGGWREVITTECGYNEVDTRRFIYETETDEDGETSFDSEKKIIINNSGTGYIGGTYGCREVIRRIYVQPRPARPRIPKRAPTPSQTLIDYQIGWNARAHSVEPMEGYGSFKFKVSRNTNGAIVGLTDTPQNKGYRDIRYGFLIEAGVVSVIENGVKGTSFGANPNAELRIARSSGRILYSIGGQVVRVRENSPDPMYLTAALYIGNDSVEDAALEGYAAAFGEMRPMAGYAGDALYNYAIGVSQVMTGSAGSYATGSAVGSFQKMTGVAADASGYATSSGSFLPMTGEAESYDIAPTYAFADGEMFMMTGAAEGVMHITGQSNGSLLPLIGLSSELAYAQGIGSFEAMTGSSDSYEGPDQAMIASALFVVSPHRAIPTLYAVIDGNMNIVGVFTLVSTQVAEVYGTIGISDDYTLAQTLRAAIESWMEANASAFDPSAAPVRDVWVYHMDAAGSTRYEGFDFNGFAKVAGAYYGLKADGIYRLEGEDDDGAQVVGRVKFGSLNFGTMSRKALPYVYVGMASNGNTYLKVTADGQTYTYRVRDNTELMKAHRFELGRGLRASFYDLELVADGTVFDLHSIEFQPVELTRRL